jgi:uncharacterized membrane protein YqaE (UPF0057 family)
VNGPAKKPEFLLLDSLRILFAILLPPVAVMLTVGHGWAFWLSVMLTLLGFVPGMVHAVWIVTSNPHPA